MKRYDVIAIGNACIDLFLFSPLFRIVRDRRSPSGMGELFALGEKYEVERLVQAAGGGAMNAAATFASLGFRTALVAHVGDDVAADFLEREMHRRRIATDYVRRVRGAATPLSVLLTSPSHERTILASRGSEMTLDAASLPKAAARWLYVTSLGGNLPLLERTIAYARKQRMPFSLNPGKKELAQRARFLRLARHAAVLFVNRDEANLLAGTAPRSAEDVAKKLRRSVPGTIVITDGTRGTLVLAGDRCYTAGVHRHVVVVERTGAGDAFGSGFVSGLLHSNGDPIAALQVGTANAEAVLSEVGAQNGLLKKFPAPARRVAVREH